MGAKLSQNARKCGAAGLCVGGALLLLGCLGGSPRPELYRLAPSGGAAAPVASLPEVGIFVGTIGLPDYLDRDEIVTREGVHRLEAGSAQRWGGALDDDVQRFVADDLGTLLGTARVAAYPVQPRFPVDWRVLVEVRAFEGEPGGRVRLHARWTLAAGDDGRAVAVRESVIEQDAASGGYEGYVAAQSAALGVLTREIAERIAALASE